MTGFYKFSACPDRMWHYINFEKSTIKSYDYRECLLSSYSLSKWKDNIDNKRVVRLSTEAECKLKLELL